MTGRAYASILQRAASYNLTLAFTALVQVCFHRSIYLDTSEGSAALLFRTQMYIHGSNFLFPSLNSPTGFTTHPGLPPDPGSFFAKLRRHEGAFRVEDVCPPTRIWSSSSTKCKLTAFCGQTSRYLKNIALVKMCNMGYFPRLWGLE